MSRTLLFTLLLISLVFMSAGLIWHQFQEQPSLATNKLAEPLQLQTSFVYPNPIAMKPFSLTDHQGRPFENQQLIGTWSLLFAGFTSCPDICPTTMGKLAALYSALNEHAPLQVVFISVDPARDHQQKLADYVQFFHPEFIAVRAEHSELLPFTKQLGMIYAMVGEGENYSVDHSGSMILINPQGEQVAIIKPSATLDPLTQQPSLPHINSQALQADIQQLQRL